jgi:hypothetical protein
MPSTAYENRQAWYDRWSVPKVEDLLDGLKSHQRRAVTRLMQGVGEMDGVEQSLIWFGPSWKWTIQYLQRGRANGARNGGKGRATLAAAGRLTPVVKIPSTNGDQNRADGLCYIVPGGLMPLICVPLRSDMIESLPERRLSKYIRDGIRSAKCAVEIHWAIWSPTTETETSLLLDLVRRKCEFHLELAGREPVAVAAR